MLAKVDPYMRPLFDALYDTMDPDRLTAYMDRGTIEVAPLAFMRGRTLNDSFIILDEAQNTTPEQMQMFLTRLGFGSKMVVTGDITQIDLPREQASGLIQVRDILREVDGIGVRRVRPRGRRPAQARAADRRGVQAARRGDRLPPARSDRGRGREPQRRRRSTRSARWRSPDMRWPQRRSTTASSGSSFVAPDEIRALKREHLGIDEETDVLSFPIDGLDELPAGVPRALGDVVLCPQVVGDEWRWPLVHGLLHLLGYDHGEEMERARARCSTRHEPRAGQQPPSLLESFNVAFEGIIHVLRTQRNMRIHFLVAVAVLVAALAVRRVADSS